MGHGGLEKVGQQLGLLSPGRLGSRMMETLQSERCGMNRDAPLQLESLSFSPWKKKDFKLKKTKDVQKTKSKSNFMVLKKMYSHYIDISWFWYAGKKKKLNKAV